MFRQVNSYTNKSLKPHQRKVDAIQSNGMGGFSASKELKNKNILTKNSRKMPYGMLQGMHKKSTERHKKQQEHDKQCGVVAETGRNKKLMQSYFEKKDWQVKEEKRLRLNTECGMNLHRHTDFRYNNGAISLSKDQVKAFESEVSVVDQERMKISEKSKGIKKLTYEDIKKKREQVEDFATGKKFKKPRGMNKKLIKKKRKK